MSDWKKQMTEAQRRKLARNLRFELRSVPPPPVAQIAADHNISRAYVYQLVEALEAWESKATFEEEVADFNTSAEYSPIVWMFVSGRMNMAHIQGDIGPDIFGAPADPRDNLLT